jgi:hypothetical protein
MMEDELRQLEFDGEVVLVRYAAKSNDGRRI